MARVLTHNQSHQTPQDALAHYGVKGMKWGIRKDRPSGSSSSGSSSSGSSNKKSDAPPMDEATRQFNAKKAAIGVGVLLGVAGAGYLAYQMQQNGGLTSFGGSKADAGQKAAERVLKEPTDVIYLARGKNRGMTFHRKGDTEDYFNFFDKAGLNNDLAAGHFSRDAEGRVASRFADPEGRRDFAGRPISHDILVPKSLASGLNSADDVRDRFWPQLKDSYDAFYDSVKPARGDRDGSATTTNRPGMQINPDGSATPVNNRPTMQINSDGSARPSTRPTMRINPDGSATPIR